MKRLSEILYLKVVTEDGKFLGHAIDYRSAGEPEHGDSRDERAVDEIVYARFGMLERLGLRKAGEKTIPMNSVRAIEEDRIVVTQAEAG